MKSSKSRNPMRRAALFDMDRTLVRHNTASLFTRYRRDCGEANLWDSLRVAMWVTQYTLGMANAEAVAKKALAVYRGTSESDMTRRCTEWFPHYVRQHVSEEARRVVREHAARGDALAIVTGSTRYAAGPLGEELGIEQLVCSELAVDEEGCFTGDVLFPLCLGAGKLERTVRFLECTGVSFDDTSFYSDSITDLPLLEAVGEPVVVNPDFRLARVAKARGWPIKRW